MPTAQQMRKFERALVAAAEIFDDVDVSSIAIPIESEKDKIREAASVIAYFDMKEQFKEETCRGCGKKFAYAFYTTSVKHCSIPCLKAMLEHLGLSWDPSKPYDKRWGGRYVPAIVPATVYTMILQQEQALEQKQPEPAPVKDISNEAKDLIKMLDSL